MHIPHVPREALTAWTVAYLAVLRVVVPNRRTFSVTFSFHNTLSGLSSDFIGETQLLGCDSNILVFGSNWYSDTSVDFDLFDSFGFVIGGVVFLFQYFSHDLVDFVNPTLFLGFLTPTGLSTLSLESGFLVGTCHLLLLQLLQSRLLEMSKETHNSCVRIDARILDESIYFNVFLGSESLLVFFLGFLVFVGVLPWPQKLNLIL